MTMIFPPLKGLLPDGWKHAFLTEPHGNICFAGPIANLKPRPINFIWGLGPVKFDPPSFGKPFVVPDPKILVMPKFEMLPLFRLHTRF